MVTHEAHLEEVLQQMHFYGGNGQFSQSLGHRNRHSLAIAASASSGGFSHAKDKQADDVISWDCAFL
jgi:hypothetical protein